MQVKQKQKRTKREKKSNVSIFEMLFITISITVILVINVFCTLSICKPDIINKVISTSSTTEDNTHTAEENIQATMSDTEKVQSALLTNGISIIGMAVAVWAGLSIFNAIEKEKVDYLYREFEKIAPDAEKIIDSYTSQLEANYNAFLFTISETNDIMCEYLHNQIKTLKGRIYYSNDLPALNSILSFCNQIEKMFRRVYSKHYNLDYKSKDEFYDDIIDNIDSALVILSDSKINEKIKCILERYLKIKKGEIYFYYGYVLNEKKIENLSYEKKARIVSRFEKSIDLFYECFPEYRFNCNVQPQIIEDLNLKVNVPIKNDLRFYLYLNNTFGEAYSKMIEAENYMGNADNNYSLNCCKALYHFESILCFMEKDENAEFRREIYYRNYGYALKRIFKNIVNSTLEITDELQVKYRDKIDYCFERSIQISIKDNDVKYKTLRGWLRLYHERCNKILKDHCVICDGGTFTKEYLEKRTVNLDEYGFKWLNSYSKKALSLLNVFSGTFEQNLYFYKYSAYIYRNLFVSTDNNVEAEDYILKFSQISEELTRIYKKINNEEDDYYKETVALNNQLKNTSIF